MSDDPSISNWYRQNIQNFTGQSDVLQKKSNRFSFLRLTVFFLFITLIITSISIGNINALLAAFILFGLIFGTLVNRHNQVKAQKLHFDNLVVLNEHEIQRLVLELGDFPDGNQYVDSTHPYCTDLDLFGPHSLFQWLNRTVTKGGELLLAKNLLKKSPIVEISERQIAVKEIAKNPEWGQQFLVSGMAFKSDEEEINRFLTWVKTKAEPPGWLKPALLILPLLAVGLTTLSTAGFITWYMVVPALVVNALVLYQVYPAAKETYDETHRSISALKAYEAMIAIIEKSVFKSSLLRSHRQPFVDKQEMASKTIKQLKDILSRIEVRHNFMYWIFNTFLLLDIIWLFQAQRWKSTHGSYITHWFKSLNCFELFVSLGLNAHGQRNFVYPLLDEDRYLFQAENLGHPLIPLDERVANNFDLKGRGMVVVLTGSNMSGKSTFLRTIGVNIVLGGMGASVCASSLHLGDISLFTSMRTTDSLEQHVSSFYAELSRINQLIKQLSQGTPILFLLDELLKGTNSKDRHLGSSTLIRQLQNEEAFGIVSTHDLTLGEMADSNDRIQNFSFNSELVDGKLSFDYKLSEGLCKSFNASALMSQMGIDIEKDYSKH